MKAYKTTSGIVIEQENSFYRIEKNWDDFINNDSVYSDSILMIKTLNPLSNPEEIIKNEADAILIKKIKKDFAKPSQFQTYLEEIKYNDF